MEVIQTSKLTVDYHGHFDKGTLIFYNRRDIIKDYGSVTYLLPLHTEYFKSTLSHSTIMIDGKAQIEADGS